MEILISGLFSSAFLGLTASLIGFLLLLFWGFMIIMGVKVERPAHKLLGVVLTALCLSMLIGLYGDTASRSLAGGVLGHWVGSRCADAGALGFSRFLLWLALPTGLLLATDWLFFGFLSGGRRQIPAAGVAGGAARGGLASVLAEGTRLVAGSGVLTKPRPVSPGTRTGLLHPRESRPDSVPEHRDEPLNEVEPFALATGSTGFAEGEGEWDEGAPAGLTAVAEPEAHEFGSDSEFEATEETVSAGLADDLFGSGEEESALPSRAGSDNPHETVQSAWWKSDVMEQNVIESDLDTGEMEEAVLEEDEELAEKAESAVSEIVLERVWWSPPTKPVESVMDESFEEAVERGLAELGEEAVSVETDAVFVETRAPDDEKNTAATNGDQVAQPEEEVVHGTEELAQSEEDAMENPEPDPEEAALEETVTEIEEESEADEVMNEESEDDVELELDDESEAQLEPQAEFSFTSEEPSGESAVSGEEAELFGRAVSLVVQEKKASISLLQKNMELGYFKAAKLLNALESRGVIAPYAGSIARKVIISDEEAERIIADENLA